MIDSLLIGVDFSNTDGTGVLIVGRKRMNQTTEIINAFSGEDARTLGPMSILWTQKVEGFSP